MFLRMVVTNEAVSHTIRKTRPTGETNAAPKLSAVFIRDQTRPQVSQPISAVLSG